MTFVFSIACSVAAVQILLSLALVFHKHNVLAIVSELATSTGLTLFISRYLLAWSLPYIILLGAAEYITVKIIILLVIVILKLRCFTILTILTHPSNRRYSVYKKRYSGRMHFISMVYRSKYHPRLKLGMPAMVGKYSNHTGIKFDKKGFPVFKSICTITLPRKYRYQTRDVHFRCASKLLYKRAISNRYVLCKFTKSELATFKCGDVPSKYTWHHHQLAGVLQLVDRKVHANTPHIGGYSIWGADN